MRVVRQIRLQPTAQFLRDIEQHKLRLLKVAPKINQNSCYDRQDQPNSRIISPIGARKREFQTSIVASQIIVLIKQIQGDLIKLGINSIGQLQPAKSGSFSGRSIESSDINYKQIQQEFRFTFLKPDRKEEIALYLSHFVSALGSWLQQLQEIITIEKFQQIMQYFEGISRELSSKAFPNIEITDSYLTPMLRNLFKEIVACLNAFQIKYGGNNSTIKRELDINFERFIDHLKNVLFVYDCSSFSKNFPNQ